MLKMVNGEPVNYPDDYIKRDGSVTMMGPLQLDTLSAGGNDATRGLSWYTPSYITWKDYMLRSGGKAPNGVVALPYGDVTAWAIRHNIENGAGFGWIWEGGNQADTTNPPGPLMSLGSNSGNLKVKNKITANIFESVVTSGTSPMIINSTTKVTNLNADMVDGIHGEYISEFQPNISKTLFQNTNYNKAYMGSMKTDGTTWGSPNDTAEQYYHVTYIPNAVTQNGYGSQTVVCYFGVNKGKTFQRIADGTTWGAWKLCSVVDTYTIPSLINGWIFWANVDYGARTITRVGNTVTLDLMVCHPTPNGNPIFTLPAGYCPAKNLIVPVCCGDNTLPQMWVLSNGNVTISGTVLPTANTWLHLHATFQAV